MALYEIGGSHYKIRLSLYEIGGHIIKTPHIATVKNMWSGVLFFRCQDYIRIDRGSFGSTEICGNAITNASLSELQSGSFTVFFRSSEDLGEDEVVYKGFQMYVLCFRSEEADSPGNPSLWPRALC